MTKDEMIEHLLMQVNTLNASLNSLQQSFDAQTALIAQLNQTIQELKEQLNKNSKNSSKPPSSDGFKKPAPKSLRKPSDKKIGGQEGHQGTYLSVISDPNEIVKHMPSACEGCPHYKMCKVLQKNDMSLMRLSLLMSWNISFSRFQSVCFTEIPEKGAFLTMLKQPCSMVRTCRRYLLL